MHTYIFESLTKNPLHMQSHSELIELTGVGCLIVTKGIDQEA